MNIYYKLIIFSTILILCGTFLTFAIFKFNFSKIKEKELDKKILMWIPMALIFILSLYLGKIFRIIIFSTILLFCYLEFKKHYTKNKKVLLYFLMSIIGLSHLGLFNLVSDYKIILVYLIIGTVVSDVFGFLLGNTIGVHKLPEYINNKKSWEGVIGQILGAIVGVILVHQYLFSNNYIFLFLPIGLGCVIGDLGNSYTKRIIGVKNWSESIPGHGGFLDRFSSLSGSSFLTFYFLLIIYLIK